MRVFFLYCFIFASLGLHAFITATYLQQPDRLAAITFFPFWVWGFLGIALAIGSYLLCRVGFALVICVLWIVTMLFSCEELLPVLRLGKPALNLQGPRHQNVRVATLHWGGQGLGYAEFLQQADAIALIRPDILFIQEIPPTDAERLAHNLYGQEGDFCAKNNLAILSRWSIQPIASSHHPTRLQALISLPNGKKINGLNLLLPSAHIDMRLWLPATWHVHSLHVKHQRNLLYQALLEWKAHPLDTNYELIAGDFNAPPYSPLHDKMRKRFIDTFFATGTSWPHTWHRRIPMVRIDYIYVLRESMRPTAAHTARIPHANHRMVISDFILLEP